MIALLGEGLALIVALYLLQRRCNFPLRLIRRPMIGSVLGLIVAGLLAGLPALNPQVPVAGPVLALTGAVVICAVAYLALPTLRAVLRKRKPEATTP
jgi:hypothetical protein